MTFHDRETAWFLAQLRPNCAQIAERNLGRQGIESFLPVEDQTRQRNGRFVTVTAPVFPGYIFVALDAAQGLWRKVNSTYGITKLVSFGVEPSQVPTSLVAALQDRCDATGKLIARQDLQPGDQVTLTQGPFAHAVAEIESVAPDQRVWVLMDIMGRQTRMAVRPEQLRAV